MQQVLGYSPLKTGLLWLPLGAGFGIGMGLCTGLMPRTGVKAMLAVGFFSGAAGLLAASYIHVNSSYQGAILPGMIVFGISSGICFPGLINGALHQLTGQDSGLGSGVQTAMQQVGAALGLATLVTLALRYAGHRIGAGVLPLVAQTGGYALAFRVGALILVAAGVLVVVLLERVDAKPRTALAEVPAIQQPTQRTH
jgi:MFS family permease